MSGSGLPAIRKIQMQDSGLPSDGGESSKRSPNSNTFSPNFSVASSEIKRKVEGFRKMNSTISAVDVTDSPTSQSSSATAAIQTVLNKYGKKLVSQKQIIAISEVLNQLNSKEKSANIEKHLKLFTQKWREDYE